MASLFSVVVLASWARQLHPPRAAFLAISTATNAIRKQAAPIFPIDDQPFGEAALRAIMAAMRTEEPAEPESTLTIEGLWDGALFHIWGVRRESEAQLATQLARSANEEAQPPPRQAWACAPASLHEAIGELSPDGLLASIAAESTLTVRLPSVLGEPLSYRLSHEILPAPARLNRFTISTLTLGPADAMDFLTSSTPAAVGRLGQSVQYWALLARFVEHALCARQFVPDMQERSDGSIEARWRLAIHSALPLGWLEQMVAAMPPVCRAMVAPEAANRDAVSLIDSFLVETTDAVVRRSLMNDSFFDDVHDRAKEEGRWELCWLSALLGIERTVRWPAEELGPIAAEIGSWAAGLHEETAEAPPRLTLRLMEPAETRDDADQTWRLAVELQTADGEGLLDVQAVWNERETTATILGRRWGSRRAHVRNELTRAARLYPNLSKVAKQSVLAGLTLSTAEAYAFLREYAPLLVAQGFDVELPEWAQQSDRQLGLQLSVRPQDERSGDFSLGRFGLGTLLEFNWRVAIGNEQLSLEEFESLATNKAPLVKLHGRWVSLDREAAEKALEFMHKEAGGKMTLMSALRLAGGADEFAAGLPIVGISGAAWLEQFLRESAQVEVENLPQPEKFHGTLRPYQLRGLAWMAFLHRLGIGACLADDMGLGKTIQLIALLLHERAVDSEAGPTMLFAPMSVVGNWQREIERFAPSLRVMIHHGPLRLTGDEFVEAANRHDVIITTYGLASRCQKDFSRVTWHRIALDEAQKIKNPSAAQTIALRGLKATYRVAMTGTPVENHLSELWSIMEVLNPGLLGSAASFRARFAVPIEKLGDQARAKQLRGLIRPFLLRRLKSDPTVACDLPEKMEMRVYCNLTPEQAAFYERVVGELLGEVDRTTGIRRRGLILATLTKLKQICNHPAHFLKTPGPLDGRSGKCERLVEMLEEVIEEGDAALVFTQYREMGDLLQAHLAARLGVEIPFLHGGTSMKNRDEMIVKFQDASIPWKVFLLSLRAGGFGLNLTNANHVFHFDRWWNPAVEDQATDRVHRIGQTRVVQVHKFVCIGTVEERIDKLLAEKTALADSIVGGGDEWLTGMSTKELREYLTLSDDAVAEN